MARLMARIAGLRRARGRFGAIALLSVMAGILASLLLHGAGWAQSPLLLAGGDTTVQNRTSQGYSQPAPNLSREWLALHQVGDRHFEAAFVTPPAPVNSGLGPLFNNTSCAGCHIRDGRGMPIPGQLLLRVSLPRQGLPNSPAPVLPAPTEAAPVLQANAHLEASVSLGNAPPVPGIGTQIQDQAVYGYVPEARVKLRWQEQPGTYADGTPYSLRSPQFEITLPSGDPLPSHILVSPRIPSPVFGTGLLEAVPEAEILALADPDDRDGDGISGRPNAVWDVEQHAEVLGRFGWKANNPTLLQQGASAYINDMGVTNPLFPEPDGSYEIDAHTLKTNTVYVQTLAVPAPTQRQDPQVLHGERLFNAANCAGCHVPTLHTGTHQVPALANQTIHPYTDLLLHDLGEGLADHRPDFRATGQEWRTPPLWGLGLVQTVLPYSGYLHDGRARTLAEAILWHGGEAASAREAFRTMPEGDRAALLKFLNSR
ncbi:di-heme oxidoredictase family protein [Thermoleptolyngbya sp. M55_K2018_002]|uniref:di-heme oxidoreductase family protein n=1 Tax=Thermoleptolyngbya sp. M55_K2018_002 TaxID=2747808 RepID=UPI00260107F5|nr:di-heme oxidoredictase family protein [Thermoleptolyngbya sp. M55_K2018_002]